MVVLDQVLLFGQLLHGADDGLALGLAVGSYARADLLVVEGVEGVVGKDLEYLVLYFFLFHNRFNFIGRFLAMPKFRQT